MTGEDVNYCRQSLGWVYRSSGLPELGPGPYSGWFVDTYVKRFQADEGLVVDGITGPATWAAIEARRRG